MDFKKAEFLEETILYFSSEWVLLAVHHKKYFFQYN